ncbi:MAG: endopeptidase La [Bdellovibrionales bacterium]
MKTKNEFLAKSIPVIPMRNMVVYPGQTLPIVVGRARSRSALETALKNGNDLILLVAQKHDLIDHEPSADDLFKVGVLARIDRHEGTNDRAYQLVVTSSTRYAVSRYEEENGHLVAYGEILDDQIDVDGETLQALVGSLKSLATEIFDLIPANVERLSSLLNAIQDPVLLTHLVAQNLDLKIARKQEILEMTSLKNRLLSLLENMVHLREQLKLQRDVNQKLSSRLGKQHRDAILREQIRTMQEELGDKPAGGKDDYREKIEQAGMPEDVKKVAIEQVERLESLGQQSPETHVVRNYLDLLVALPWSKSSQAEIDLDAARAVLDADHYGLEKIKKRIIQHLAVLKLKQKKGSILLFVGPPGVGKTSLGKSIAKAMNRKFVRVSLGGVRDDAEIRGHRRTYVGALPGRIVDGIKRAEENNPVFMLDEIDKMARGWGGDPAATMLEVLDPEQNAKFLDHYLDVPFDLSNVFFIGTANTLDTIPAPLLDRMEIIHLSGYTTAEKLHISRTHLVPKQLEDHGVKPGQLEISEAAQLRMINAYTREAGVRELQRLISAVVRASTEKILLAKPGQPVKVDVGDLDEILGNEKFVQELVGVENPPGVVTGLAWTPMGGEILYIESSKMPGKGQLTLTGQLGDVMKESAQIAMSLVRSRLAKGNFDHEHQDIHLHVPAGAIPKDGPSAGVAMVSAIASLVLGKPVSSRIAMTGEITLRGAVTPVGGIKEKVIAAHRAGIQKVLLPKRNERDLKEVPDEVKKDLQFLFAETVEEALHHILGLEPEHWSGSRAANAESPLTASPDAH